MKKTFTYSFLVVAFCGFFISCSKDVKAPAKVTRTTMASTNTNTGTQTTGQTPNDHQCGGSYTGYNGGGGH
jgi:hypothetical protein